MNELKTIDCRQCIGYKNCPGKEWFSWEDIRWCSHQVYFIIAFSEVFIEGIWPDPPEYLETDIVQKSMSTEASFVKATSVLAEVEARLLRTKKDGEWLVSLINNECPIDELPYDPKMAFYYITGWHRYGKDSSKWQDYSGWKKHRKYRARLKKLATKSHENEKLDK